MAPGCSDWNAWCHPPLFFFSGITQLVGEEFLSQRPREFDPTRHPRTLPKVWGLITCIWVSKRPIWSFHLYSWLSTDKLSTIDVDVLKIILIVPPECSQGSPPFWLLSHCFLLHPGSSQAGLLLALTSFTWSHPRLCPWFSFPGTLYPCYLHGWVFHILEDLAQTSLSQNFLPWPQETKTCRPLPRLSRASWHMLFIPFLPSLTL